MIQQGEYSEGFLHLQRAEDSGTIPIESISNLRRLIPGNSEHEKETSDKANPIEIPQEPKISEKEPTFEIQENKPDKIAQADSSLIQKMQQ